MDFILVDESAAKILVSERTVQSTDFAEGTALAILIKDGVVEGPISSKLSATRQASGLYVLAETGKRVLVFDLKQASPFKNYDYSQSLVILQRTLRLALKTWGNLRLGPSEHAISNSKLVLFPFPNATHSQYRLTIDKRPVSRYISGEGPHLLVFREGTDAGSGAQAQPETAVYDWALKNIPQSVPKSTQWDKSSASELNVLSVTKLTASRDAHVSPHLSFEAWIPLLTKTQRDFVSRPVVDAERIEGPAGTGKTLSLVLRCVTALRTAVQNSREHHSIFVSHSEATAQALEDIFATVDTDGFWKRERKSSQCSVKVTTLQRWCGEQLASRISESEFLDQDALEAKQQRLYIIRECLDSVMKESFPTFAPFLSREFREFIETEERWVVTEMLQHEIGVMIKGRADENLDIYRALPNVLYNLPISTDQDHGLIFEIFRKYKAELEQIGLFDSDDVVLSAIGQLDSPIWRRRRAQEGFDSIFIDETHLFNMNEVSIFHFLKRDEAHNPIVFSIDRSQASGDRGLTPESLNDAMSGGERIIPTEATSVRAVFRSSPQITALALSVTASGATLFTNFENPLETATSAFTQAEEERASTPVLNRFANDNEMVSAAFARAEVMAANLNSNKSNVLIVGFSPALMKMLEEYGNQRNKPFELLRRRGDIETVARARKSSRFVLSSPDYVGGLEFDGAVLVGVDEGRVPPAEDARTIESRHFLSYGWHNRLYVAITRAKYALDILISDSRQPSPILRHALENRLLEFDRAN